jgi:hypothetical protein
MLQADWDIEIHNNEDGHTCLAIGDDLEFGV